MDFSDLMSKYVSHLNVMHFFKRSQLDIYKEHMLILGYGKGIIYGLKADFFKLPDWMYYS